MAVTFDTLKREWTLEHRGLDFAEAEEVFAGSVVEAPDLRRDYGEIRIITVGRLRGRMVVIGWTPRGPNRHVFTMRNANEREIRRYRERLGEG